MPPASIAAPSLEGSHRSSAAGQARLPFPAALAPGGVFGGALLSSVVPFASGASASATGALEGEDDRWHLQRAPLLLRALAPFLLAQKLLVQLLPPGPVLPLPLKVPACGDEKPGAMP